MSTSPLYHRTVNIVDRAAAKITDRATSIIARKHSRVSVIAATTAAAGVLGAAGFAVGAAPWAQAVDNVAKTVQGNTPTASGQPGGSLFQAITGTKTQDGKPLASGPLDAIRSAPMAGGGVGVAAGAKHQVAAVPLNLAPKQATKPQPAKPQPAKHKAAAHPAAKPKVAKPAARHQAAKPKAHAAPPKPYLMYDSVKPETLPHGKEAAVYVNGAYAAFPRQLGGLHSVLWIDTNGSDPAANVLDVEPGDATPAGAAQWVKHRLSSQPHSVAIIYTMRSDWQQVKDNVAALPGWMQSKVRYWIADPTGVPHVVAGSSATQWYWGDSYDITTANPDFVR
jgi:hypothetical protein